jgi:hypothetical protein
VLCDPNGHHQLPSFEGSGDGVPAARVVVLEEVLRVVDVVLRELDISLVMLVDVLLNVFVVECFSVEQSVSPHLSLQSFRHMSVQFTVPVGHPQSQRSLFARLKAHAPIRVPTASAYVSARPSQPHWLHVVWLEPGSDALAGASL